MMNAILGLGKYLFAVPFLIFGLFHFMNGPGMAEAMGVPGGVAMVYFTGVALIAAAISIFIGKYDKLAATLLALFLFLTALIIQLPGAMDGDQASMSHLLKDLALAGAAMMYAANVARDPAIIG